MIETRKVLLVEDEALVRLGLAMVLEDAGYSVLEASNADEALSVLHTSGDVRVLVTDVHMPGTMDGARLAHYVRAHWPAIGLMVISGEPGDLYQRLPPGTIFCAKPITDALLVSAVGVAMASVGRHPTTEVNKDRWPILS